MSDQNPPTKRERRPHPLERPPEPPEEQAADSQHQQVMLHIPFVKPYVTYALIAVNVIIFFVGLASPDFNATLLNAGVSNRVLVLENGEYHRLLTAMFLHGGLAHLLFNMYALYAIGSTLEGLFGHARFALVYFLGGLAGSVASVVFNGPNVFSVGASGAVFAVFGAEMVYLYNHRKLLGASGRARFRSLVIIAGLNLAYGLFSSLQLGPVVIDNWGHIGGFIGGIALTWYIGPLLLLRRHPERENAFLAEDVNPLSRRYQEVALYTAALLALLIVATLAAR